MNYQSKLRALADYLDAHPLVADKTQGRYACPAVYVIAEDWEAFQTLISDLGEFDKSGYAGSLDARHIEPDEEAGGHAYRVVVSVSGVCEAKPKLDEDGHPVTRKVMKTIETDEEETVMEYDCPKVWSITD